MAFQAVLSRQLATLAEQLSTAAAEDTASLAAQVAELTAARDQFRARAEELTALNDALSIELETRAVERETASQALATLDAERRRASELTAQIAVLQEQLGVAVRERDETAAVVQALRQAADVHDRDLDTVRALAADMTAARDREANLRQTLENEIAGLRTRLTSVRGELDAETARLRAEFAAAQAAADGETALLREELGAARAAHRDRTVAQLSHTFEEIDRGASVDDVLSAAANALADDFPRVAVFTAANGKLEPRYQRGFEEASGIERAVPDPADGSLLGRAASSPELGVHQMGPTVDLPFAGSPSMVVTAPVVVRGELIAMIYADDHGRPPVDDGRHTSARIADIVRRHTALRLDRLTIELKTMGELRGYAKMLLDEVEYVYRADVSARKSDAERLERLTENLRCARQIYLQRASVEGPVMTTLIEEVLAATVAAKSATPFGRELASIAAAAQPAAV
jgi:hypothetical protein